MQALVFPQTLSKFSFSFPTLPFSINSKLAVLSFCPVPKVSQSCLPSPINAAECVTCQLKWPTLEKVYCFHYMLSSALLCTHLHCSLGLSQKPGLFFSPIRMILFWQVVCYEVWHKQLFTNDWQPWPCANKKSCVLEEFTRWIWESSQPALGVAMSFSEQILGYSRWM